MASIYIVNEETLENIARVLEGEEGIKIIKLLNEKDNITVEEYTEEKIGDADLAICTFGISLYELIYLNIPTVSIAHSKENANSSLILEKKFNGFVNLGYYKDIKGDFIREVLNKFIYDMHYFESMMNKCKNFIDGKGANRIAEIIQKFSYTDKN